MNLKQIVEESDTPAGKAFDIIIQALIVLSLVSFSIETLPGLGMNTQFFHSLWWSVVTLTTVGYGDVYPIINLGEIFSSLVMFVGIGLFALPSGLIASALTKVIKNEEKE